MPIEAQNVSGSSVLDRHPLLSTDIQSAILRGGSILQAALQNLGEENDPRFQALASGASPYAVLGFEKSHLEALYSGAYDRLSAGDVTGARDLLLTLLRLEPQDERAVYALGVAYQMDGDHETALNLFALFVGLDATNAEGYLRIGECLLVCGEAQNAADCFEIAAEEAARGHGGPDSRAYAERMMATARAVAQAKVP